MTLSDNDKYTNKTLKTDNDVEIGVIKKIQDTSDIRIVTIENQGRMFLAPIPNDQLILEPNNTVKISTQFFEAFYWELRTEVERRQIWKELDTKFKDTMNSAKETFTINKNVNIILVIIGVVLITNSLIYTWSRGSDGFSLLTGGAGIATVVSLFFYRPQLNINKALKTLASVDMTYKSHYLTLESISDYNTLHTYDRNIQDLKDMNELLKDITTSYMQMLEDKTTKVNDSEGET
jgi:hypothetical protein